MEMLSDEILQEALGQEQVDRAYVDLASGKVIERIYLTEGEIAARWDNQAGSPEMHARMQEDNLLMICTCKQFHQEGACAHIIALLVAWASQRQSFATVAELVEPGSNEVLPGNIPAKNSSGEPTFDPVQDYRRILNHFTVPELREMARLRNVPLSGIKREPILDTLAQAFSQREKLGQDWQKLSPQARLLAGLLPFLTHVSNTASLEQIAQSFGIKDKVFTQTLDELKTFGLIYVESYGGIYFPAVLPFWMPPDPDFAAVPELDVKSFRVQLAREPRSFYQAATRLLILLQAASEAYQARVDMRTRDIWKKIPFLQGWPVDAADMERVSLETKPYHNIQQQGIRISPAPSLLTNDARVNLAAAMRAAPEEQVSPEEVDFLIRLLQAIQLMQITPGKPVRPKQGAILSVLQYEAIQLAKELFALYASLETWTEIDLALAHPKSLKLILRDYNRGNYGQFVKKIGAVRERLLVFLRRLPAGQWYSLAGLAKRASLFPFRSMLHGLVDFGFFEIDGRKLNLDRPDDSQALIARLLESMLAGPLYWQGAVDLAWEKDRLAGFRFTPLGGALLAQPVDFQMPRPLKDLPALDFTPEGNLVLQLEAASSTLIGLLVQLGNIQVNQQGAVVVHPTLLGAGRAFETGWTTERIFTILAAEAGKPVPPDLMETLQKWWQNFGSVQLYQDIALIEFNDDFALNELLGGTSLPRYLLFRFSPRLVAIRPEGVAELREEMVKKGYTPKTAA
jgi:hypothetical protein